MPKIAEQLPELVTFRTVDGEVRLMFGRLETMSPAQARQLAVKLLRDADIAEGKTSHLGERTLNPLELNSIYVGDRDRFVVSLIVGYGKEDRAKTPEQALYGALSLTTDENQDDTNWFVFDRKKGTGRFYEQHEARYIR